MKRFFLRHITFIKYFVPYFIILAISLSGLLYIVNIELRKKFEQTYEEQLDQNIRNYLYSFENRFFNLAQIDYVLSRNVDMIFSRYQENGYQKYRAKKELEKLIGSNSMIADILYIDGRSAQVINNSCLAYKENGALTLIQADGASFLLPWNDLFNESNIGYLRSISSGAHTLLVYKAAQSSPNYVTLFILNTASLIADLNSVMLPGTVNISITDSSGNVLLSSNQTDIAGLTKSEAVSSPEQHLLLYPCDFPNVSIAVLSDGSQITDLLSSVFKKTYIVILLILAAGILCGALFLFITYMPLKRLSHSIRIGRNGSSSEEKLINSKDIDLKYIETTFHSIATENELLMKKVHDYRLIMQKSILSAAEDTCDSPLDRHFDETQIDSLFQQDSDACFLVVCFCFACQKEPDDFVPYLEQKMELCKICIILERGAERIAALLCLPQPLSPDCESFRAIIMELEMTFSCHAYLSSVSDTPMDTARLYEDALQTAAECTITDQSGFSRSSFSDSVSGSVSVTEPSAETGKFSKTTEENWMLLYPYQILDRLAVRMENTDLENALHSMQELFRTLRLKQYPDFFNRCILLDMLTLIIGYIPKSNVPFKNISDSYYQTLYYCRSRRYLDCRNEVEESFFSLLTRFRAELDALAFNIKEVKQFIAGRCMDSSFSIVQLGERFHVTGPYISAWFKKNTGCNISDYVWELRQQRAKELMENPKLTMNDISHMVGYDNYTSFRRKFKDENGISPSEYRRSQGN